MGGIGGVGGGRQGERGFVVLISLFCFLALCPVFSESVPHERIGFYCFLKFDPRICLMSFFML